jgi:hypothetical protein
MDFKESLCAPPNYVRLPAVSGHPEERRASILGVLPRVLGMFLDGSGCFFGLGASGGGPKAGSTKCEKSVEELGLLTRRDRVRNTLAH